MDRNQRPVSWSTHGGLLLCWAHHHWLAPPLSDLCHALLTYATPGRPVSIRYASTKRAPHRTRSLRYREPASTRVPPPTYQLDLAFATGFGFSSILERISADRFLEQVFDDSAGSFHSVIYINQFRRIARVKEERLW